MRTILVTCVVILVAGCLLPAAQADRYPQIQRRVVRAESNAYIRTLRLNYPGPVGLRLGNYVDTRILSQDGLLDQILKQLLAQSAQSMVARQAPQNNPVLDDTLKRSEQILKDLGIDSSPPVNNNGNKDYSNFDKEIP